MACAARLCLVRSGQREFRRGVIKRRGRPRVLGVTGLAILGKVIRRVVRIACVVVVRRVALVAIVVRQLVVAPDVTILARRGSVRAL